MTVTDATVDAATPEQLKLVAQFYFLLGANAADFFRNNLPAILKSVQLSVAKDKGISGALEKFKTIRSARVLIRNGEITNKLDHHVFPECFIDNVLSSGVRVLVNPKKNYYEYYLEGSMNGKQGRFEVGVEANKANPHSQNITHATFREIKDPKEMNLKLAAYAQELQKQRLAAIRDLEKKTDNGIIVKPPSQKEALPSQPPAVKPGQQQPEAVNTGINYSELAHNMANAAKMGIGMSAVFNIGLLWNGEIRQFGFEILKDGAISCANSAAGDMLQTTLGDYAGPVGAIVISALIDTKNLYATGDWARFGKNLGINGVGVLAGAGGGALAGLMGGGPVGAIVGLIAGGFAGRYVAGEWIPGLSGLTKKEKKMIMNKVTTELKEAGVKLPSGTTYEQFLAMMKRGEVQLRGAINWADVQSGKIDKQSFFQNKAYKAMLKSAFICAELRSPSGDITEGLKLLIEDVKSIKKNK